MRAGFLVSLDLLYCSITTGGHPTYGRFSEARRGLFDQAYLQYPIVAMTLVNGRYQLYKNRVGSIAF